MAAPEREAQRWILAAIGLLEARAPRGDWLSGPGRLAGAGRSAALLRQRFGISSADEARRSLKRHFSRAGSARESASRIFWLTRASALAAWACGCFLLDLDEAWAAMRRAAAGLQSCAASWSDLGQGYLRGHALHGREPLELEMLVTRIDRLLDGRRGIWSAIPWATPLREVSAPRVKRRLRLIAGGR